MFSIDLAPHYGADKGEIVIGSFRETFEFDLHDWSVADYVANWRKALGDLFAGAERVALMTWASTPSSREPRRGWLLYRVGDFVFVQDRLFLPDADDVVLDATGGVHRFGTRETVSDDGKPVSEWRTTFAAVRMFFESRNRLTGR